MKKTIATLKILGQMFVLLLIVALAWGINGIQKLFHGTSKAGSTDNPLFSVKTAHADDPTSCGWASY